MLLASFGQRTHCIMSFLGCYFCNFVWEGPGLYNINYPFTPLFWCILLEPPFNLPHYPGPKCEDWWFYQSAWDRRHPEDSGNVFRSPVYPLVWPNTPVPVTNGTLIVGRSKYEMYCNRLQNYQNVLLNWVRFGNSKPFTSCSSVLWKMHAIASM